MQVKELNYAQFLLPNLAFMIWHSNYKFLQVRKGNSRQIPRSRVEGKQRWLKGLMAIALMSLLGFLNFLFPNWENILTETATTYRRSTKKKAYGVPWWCCSCWYYEGKMCLSFSLLCLSSIRMAISSIWSHTACIQHASEFWIAKQDYEEEGLARLNSGHYM